MFEQQEWVALAGALASAEPRQLSDAQLIDGLCGWDRLVGWAQAGQFALLAEFARRRSVEAGCAAGSTVVPEFAADEVAAALRLSRNAAGARLHLAVELAHRLTGTAAALARGELDLPKVRAMVEATTALDLPVAAAVEQCVLPAAGQQIVGRLRAVLSRAVLAADPAAAEVRHERAVADRQVRLTPLPDGMAELWALLPADAAVAVHTAIDTHARQQPADDRRMAVRRADALVALVTGDGAAAPGPLVHVTVAATTLLGAAGEPGELAGYGPVPAGLARRLAADPAATWRRILTDPPSGTLLDVGRTSYRPPTALARHVVARDRTCRFPGCAQPAHRCDLDHVRPWPAGRTAAGNLIALCRHHHRLKHTACWQVTTAGSAVAWTAPTGHRYTTHPPPITAGAG